MGCPATKILKSKSGSYLMKDPIKAGECVKALVENLSIPVSVKMRIGFDGSKDKLKETKNEEVKSEEEIGKNGRNNEKENKVNEENYNNYLEVAKECIRQGADFVGLHGRTVEQGYSGEADLSKIKKLVDNVDVSVIGNGDIKDIKSFEKMKTTNCDAFMIGREAIGNPLIFAKLKGNKIKNENINPISMFYKYLEKAIKYKIDFKAIRQQAIFFMKGFDGASKIRGDLIFAKSIEEIKSLLNRVKI
jgi:tRNA-dihydrouridine synthase